MIRGVQARLVQGRGEATRTRTTIFSSTRTSGKRLRYRCALVRAGSRDDRDVRALMTVRDPCSMESDVEAVSCRPVGISQAQLSRNAVKTVALGALAAMAVGYLSPLGVTSTIAVTTPFAQFAPFASLALAIPAVSAEAMATAFRSAWAGLAAGCLHTLAGADHLAALTPLTIGQSHLRASMLGALWGFGHSTGQLFLGLCMVVLKDRFHQLVPALSRWGGLIVGLTLVAIGVLGVWESYFEDGDHHHGHGHHHHGHNHDAAASGSEVGAAEGTVTRETGAKKKMSSLGSSLATFATGIVYGLQPDALFVIIPALALPTKLAATAYIVMFVVGTIAAMGAYAGVIGATSQAFGKNKWATSNLSGAASAVAILIGSGILLASCGIQTPLAFVVA